MEDDRIFPIPIGPDQVAKLFLPDPLGFTKSQADKVCRFVQALANEEPTE